MASLEQLQEQMDHLESYVDKISQGEYIYKDEHREIRERLRALEQIALNMERETFAYAQNTSLNFVGSQDKEIDALFDEARDTHLHIERFVRTLETRISTYAY